VDQVLETLDTRGILLVQDKRLPSVVGIITGEALSTSWWGHPRAQEIFATLDRLSDRSDVLFTKLLYGKDTLVHRRLWPALLTVGTAREPWQVDGVSSEARRLLHALDEGDQPIGASGPAVKELAARLLACARQEHTQSGRHETVVEPWSLWSRRVKCDPAPSVAEARGEIERATLELGASLRALPWARGNTSPRG